MASSARQETDGVVKRPRAGRRRRREHVNDVRALGLIGGRCWGKARAQLLSGACPKKSERRGKGGGQHTAAMPSAIDDAEFMLVCSITLPNRGQATRRKVCAGLSTRGLTEVAGVKNQRRWCFSTRATFLRRGRSGSGGLVEGRRSRRTGPYILLFYAQKRVGEKRDGAPE